MFYILYNNVYRKRKKKKNLALIELYQKVSDASGIHRNTTKAVLDSLWKTLRESITQGNELAIPDFGTFCQKMRAERTTNDVNNIGRRVYNPPSTLIHFEPVKPWKEEHYIANAELDVDNIPAGATLSKRFYNTVVAKYGKGKAMEVFV